MSKVIKVQNLSKQYRLGTVGISTFKEDYQRLWAKLRGKEDPFLNLGVENDRTLQTEQKFVWSLKDINFDVNQGDVLGIIGRNGAGKSTLLKILSKVTAPTTGSVKVKGRIASLLEVGTGFHPELTGRENIYLNGAILGMRKHEITRKLEEIISFAGVEKYADTPVKRYSSGMYVRLAFAVAAHLESEILIVDEVLAVGDFEFQKKCLGKMGDISKKDGRTILFVSHNMSAVKELCNQGIYFENGKLSNIGKIDDLIDSYYNTPINNLNKTILVSLKYENSLNYWKVGEYITLKVIYPEKYIGYTLDIAIYDKYSNRLVSIEGSKLKSKVLFKNEVEFRILNPSIINSILTVDIGIKKDFYESYFLLENSIVQIKTKESSEKDPFKGLISTEIYVKDEKINGYRLLD